MNRKIGVIAVFPFWLGQFFLFPNTINGFETETHKRISDRATTPGISIIHSLLTNFWFEFEDGNGVRLWYFAYSNVLC